MTLRVKSIFKMPSVFLTFSNFKLENDNAIPRPNRNSPTGFTSAGLETNQDRRMADDF
jgi:hypothetical protein